MHLKGEAFATHSVVVEDAQAAAAEAAGYDTFSEFLSPLVKDGLAASVADRRALICHSTGSYLPLPGAGVSCALVYCRFLQVRGLTVSLCRCCSARSLLTARGKTSPPKKESIWGLAVSGCR